MSRSLALIALSLSSVVWFGCSNNDSPTPPKPPVVVGDDMGDGTGGNGGTGGSGGGGGSTGSGDMAQGGGAGDMAPGLPDLAGLPAPDHDPKQHPPLPTMSNATGSSTISAPEVWTVVWQGDETLGAKVNTFTSWMLTSDYWKAGMTEYGVGAGVAKGVAVIPSAPPAKITDAQIQSLIESNLGKTGWPASKNANTVISVVLDPKTTNTSNGGSCTYYDGYHSITATKRLPYLINAYCPDAMGNPDWNNLTVTISHEAAEATGDWDLNHYRVTDAQGNKYLGGGELGDMCLSLNGSFMATATDTYLVQRLWSNSIAKMNNADPCVPVVPAGAWFGAGLYSGNSDQSVVQISTDTSGKGSAKFKIEPFSFDPNFGPVGFYVAGSLLPTGMTMSPDIAVRTVNNMRVGSVLYGNPGSTTEVTVSVDSTFQNTGAPTTLLIIARDVMKTRYNIWWGLINVQ